MLKLRRKGTVGVLAAALLATGFVPVEETRAAVDGDTLDRQRPKPPSKRPPKRRPPKKRPPSKRPPKKRPIRPRPKPAPKPAEPEPPAWNYQEQGPMAGFSTAHNQARKEIPVPAMTWSPAIAERAQRHAEHCVLSYQTGHSEDAGYGLNIFATSQSTLPAASFVTKQWTDQKSNFDENTQACTDGKVSSCGPYMVIVQRDNAYFGCGMSQCPDGVTIGTKKNEMMKQLWVCLYDGGKIEYGKDIY